MAVNTMQIKLNSDGEVSNITISKLFDYIQEVSKDKSIESGKAKYNVKFVTKDGNALAVQLVVNDVEKFRNIMQAQSELAKTDQEKLKLFMNLRDNIVFFQDYGISKNGKINVPSTMPKFKLENAVLNKLFNVNRKTLENQKDINDLYKADLVRENWVLNRDYNPSDDKITSFVGGKVGFAADGNKIEDWVFISGKAGGANSAGEEGGIYKRGDLTALIKQENKRGKVDSVSNMCEFLGSIMFQYAKPGYGAKVFLAKNSQENVKGNINTTDSGDVYGSSVFFDNYSKESVSININTIDGSDIYVGSVFFDNYRDLYVDAHIQSGLEVPKDRPWLVGKSAGVFSKMINNQNYQGLEDIMPLSLLIGDFDVHWGNVGAIRQPGQEVAKMVRIDFAWAFRGDFEEEVYPHSQARHLPIVGPTNHFIEYPESMRINEKFVRGLNDIYEYNFSNAIEDGIKQIKENYDIIPIKSFAQKIGMQDLQTNDKEKLVDSLQEYLQKRIAKRQVSLKNYATEIELSLAFNKNQDGKWCFTSYKDEKGQDIDLRAIILKNPDFIKKIISGQADMSLRRDDQKKPGSFTYRLLDFFNFYKRYIKYQAKSELKEFCTNNAVLVDTSLKDVKNGLENPQITQDIVVSMDAVKKAASTPEMQSKGMMTEKPSTKDQGVQVDGLLSHKSHRKERITLEPVNEATNENTYTAKLSDMQSIKPKSIKPEGMRVDNTKILMTK